jgi:hypothetical protein
LIHFARYPIAGKAKTCLPREFDWGAPISSAMARQAPAGLLGIHLNLPATVPPEVEAALAGGGPHVATQLYAQVQPKPLGTQDEQPKQPLKSNSPRQ